MYFAIKKGSGILILFLFRSEIDLFSLYWKEKGVQNWKSDLKSGDIIHKRRLQSGGREWVSQKILIKLIYYLVKVMT